MKNTFANKINKKNIKNDDSKLRIKLSWSNWLKKSVIIAMRYNTHKNKQIINIKRSPIFL